MFAMMPSGPTVWKGTLGNWKVFLPWFRFLVSDKSAHVSATRYSTLWVSLWSCQPNDTSLFSRDWVLFCLPD